MLSLWAEDNYNDQDNNVYFAFYCIKTSIFLQCSVDTLRLQLYCLKHHLSYKHLSSCAGVSSGGRVVKLIGFLRNVRPKNLLMFYIMGLTTD